MLAERAEKEATDITAILTELERAIRDQLDDPDYQQRLPARMAPIEQEQFERNVDALRRRLQEIPERDREGDGGDQGSVRRPAARMFPVAVTFLVPERMAG